MSKVFENHGEADKFDQNKDIFIHNLRTVLKDTIQTNNLIEKGDRVLVALSGGADSVFLLHMLLSLKKELEIKEIGAAHLNHMIRGAEADSDEAFSAELCTKLRVPFYAKRCDIPGISQKEGISEELAGRNERYKFFYDICEKNGYTKIATAHNKNDRAETLLMRLMRGTGTDGLGSIRYSRDNIIRPILDIERSNIEEYCRRMSIDYCTDSTNKCVDYTRNRVRCELLPLMAEKFNPSIVNTLCQLADCAAEDGDFINGYAKRLYARINSPMPKKKPVVLDIESLKMVDKGIRNRIILLAAKDVMGEDYTLSRNHIDGVNSLLDKQTGASVALPGDLRVNVKYGWLEFITAKEEEEKTHPYSYLIDINMDDNLSENVNINDITTDRFDLKDIKASDYNISLNVTDPKVSLNKRQMMVDFDKLEGKLLTIRNRRNGDKIVLYKDSGSKKLKSYFIDKKVPRSKRGQIPLLCAEDPKSGKCEIAAIIGDRVAENYKINTDTRKGLLISYGTDNEDR